ncbi:hypothetical protein SEA_GAZEBO_75 [Microbacterium phage Gazebo]|nr:hypothetical protein SEA_GAZEBO_75 [Microbacterium phage Gazebo]
MTERLFDVIKKGSDLNKITAAIGGAIDSRSVEDDLRELGLDVQVDTIDYSRWGVITIEGGENENGVILTLRLEKVEIGYDVLNVKDGESDG